MQKTLRIAVAALIVLGIIAYMTTYSVRFTETAVITTFGSADSSSIRTEPGLGFKWPYPIQTVTKYDTRARYLEIRPAAIATADDRQVIVSVYMTWRVKDPLTFLKSNGTGGSRASEHFGRAEATLQAALRSATSQVSRYRLSDLVSATGQGSKLPELEAGILASLASTAEVTGVEPLAVGVSGIELPEATTKAVFERMKAARQRIATEFVSRGQAARDSIKSTAEGDSKKILDFAERRAAVIRSMGEAEAAQYYAAQKQDPDLAVFLQHLEFMRRAIARQVTLVIPVSTPGFGLMQPTPPATVPQLNIPTGDTGAAAPAGTTPPPAGPTRSTKGGGR